MAERKKVRHIDLQEARQKAESDYDGTLVSLVGQLKLNLDAISVDNVYYVDATQIFEITCVDSSVFKKADKSHHHYVIYKKKFYVSRYGLLLILSSSKQPAAVALVDYILSIFIKLETTGVVTREDVKETRQSVEQQLAFYKNDVPDASQAELKKIQEIIKAKGVEIIEMPSTISRLERECKIVSKGLETIDNISKHVQTRNSNMIPFIEKIKYIMENLSKLAKYLSKSPNKTFANPQNVKDAILQILDVSVFNDLAEDWAKINITEKTFSDEFITILNELKCDLDECSNIQIDPEEDEVGADDKTKILEDIKSIYTQKGYKLTGLGEYNIVYSKKEIHAPNIGIRREWDVMSDKELEQYGISQKCFPLYARTTYNNFQEISDDFKVNAIDHELYPFPYILYDKMYMDTIHKKIICQLMEKFNPMTETSAVFIVDLITSTVKS